MNCALFIHRRVRAWRRCVGGDVVLAPATGCCCVRPLRVERRVPGRERICWLPKASRSVPPASVAGGVTPLVAR